MKSDDSNRFSDIPHYLDHHRLHLVSKEFRHSVLLHLPLIEGDLFLLGDPFFLRP